MASNEDLKDKINRVALLRKLLNQENSKISNLNDQLEISINKKEILEKWLKELYCEECEGYGHYMLWNNNDDCSRYNTCKKCNGTGIKK